MPGRVVGFDSVAVSRVLANGAGRSLRCSNASPTGRPLYLVEERPETGWATFPAFLNRQQIEVSRQFYVQVFGLSAPPPDPVDTGVLYPDLTVKEWQKLDTAEQAITLRTASRITSPAPPFFFANGPHTQRRFEAVLCRTSCMLEDHPRVAATIAREAYLAEHAPTLYERMQHTADYDRTPMPPAVLLTGVLVDGMQLITIAYRFREWLDSRTAHIAGVALREESQPSPINRVPPVAELLQPMGEARYEPLGERTQIEWGELVAVDK